jgi:sulfonate transport system substrate-binding protein
VQAWDIWPPYVQQVVAQDGARVLATGSAYGSAYSFEVASKSAIADPAKAAAIKSYLTILNKAYLWAATHPSAWATAWGKATGLPDSVMNAAAKVEATTPVPVTSAITSSEQNLVDQFFAAGLIPAKVDISQYVTTQLTGRSAGRDILLPLSIGVTGLGGAGRTRPATVRLVRRSTGHVAAGPG